MNTKHYRTATLEDLAAIADGPVSYPYAYGFAAAAVTTFMEYLHSGACSLEDIKFQADCLFKHVAIKKEDAR